MRTASRRNFARPSPASMRCNAVTARRECWFPRVIWCCACRKPTSVSIRVGLSGNLCRCTGYVGIVRAVQSVIEARRARDIAPDAGRRAEDPGSRRLWSKRHQTAPSAVRPAGSEPMTPEAVGSAPSIPDFIPANCPGAAVQRRASARAGLCDVRRHRSRRGLSSRRVIDGAAEAGARRRRDPRQDRSDRRDVPGSRTGRAKPRRYVRPHRRHRQRPAQPVFDAGRNPLPAGADRAGDARRTFHRIHADRNAGAGRQAGAGARSRGAIDRGVCRQSRPPPVGYVRRAKRSGRAERNGAGFRSFARAGGALVWSFLVRQDDGAA